MNTAFTGKITCPLVTERETAALNMAEEALQDLRKMRIPKMNAIWLEVTGCSGNIISLLDASEPDVYFMLKEMVNMTYNNSIMAEEGERAYEKFLETLDTDFILFVDGAVALKDNGRYNIIAKYKGREITALEAVKLAGSRAKYVLAVGACASHGGVSAARPNPSDSVSAGRVLAREVITLPGCPCNPRWVIGTLAHILVRGRPELNWQNSPVLFYGMTIHDRCPRRSFFDNGIFAQKLGEKTCMFKLGCRGPVTRTDCAVHQWNGRVNWPIGDNTPCIGCAAFGFPDAMEPFVVY